jgi:UDP-N-acetylmuramyl pentapeptide phosphotransferase/UDP-N-acetylglucosamine-1-phosphate transferase
MSGVITVVLAMGWLILATAISAGLIVVLYPLLKRYALAKPNARSSHATPTPQGGGIAVVAATIVTTDIALYWFAAEAVGSGRLLTVFGAAILIACVGALDDIRPIPVIPRLVLQALAVGVVVYALPDALRVLPFLPWGVERILLVIGGLWFVNLVNFMDGLDRMTVAEVVPITAALAAIGAFGFLPQDGSIVALALCGATIGFAFFNRPVAKLFLGDVGSLPIGLLVGWLLLALATRGHLAAAVVLPLYYLADATVTLLRRLRRGEPVWQAHRQHFYQLATDRGFSVTAVAGSVFAVNIGLCALALLSVIVPGRLTEGLALVGGVILVAGLLVAFARGRKDRC